MLAYFASRPYIHVLNAETLSSFPTQFGRPDILPQPVAPPDELTLQTQSTLEFVQSWAVSPSNTQVTHCQSSENEATFPSCTLANETYLAIFDPQGARLTYLFAVTQIDNSRHELHQLIGPSWQVAPGIDTYPGAFADTDNSSLSYEPILDENTLVFTSQDGTRAKIFQLTENGINVEYQTQKPITTQIPLMVDPWIRFTPGWADKYWQQNTPDRNAWGLRNGPMVSIHIIPVGGAEGMVTIQTFNESLSLLTSPEDPDFDYPPGHYIPFPMAIAEAEMQDGYFLRLERLP
jgi:hypothetical protein